MSKPLEALLASHCTGCHDGSARQPMMGAALLSEDTLALRAALKVAAYEMPPAPMPMSDQERFQLIDELCAVGAKRPDLCRHYYAYRSKSPRLLNSKALLRMFNGVAPTKKETGTHEFLVALDHVPLFARVLRLDPTVEVLRVIDAGERCPPPDGPGGPAAYDTCVHALLNSDDVEFPQPARPDRAEAPR